MWNEWKRGELCREKPIVPVSCRVGSVNIDNMRAGTTWSPVGTKVYS